MLCREENSIKTYLEGAMEKSIALFLKRDVLAGAVGGAVDYVWDVVPIDYLVQRV